MTDSGVSNSISQDPVTGVPGWRSRRVVDRGRVLDTTMRVTTPENISFQYQIVGPFRRIYAYVLDVLISLVGYSLVVFLVNLIFSLGVLPLAELIGWGAFAESIMGILAGLTIIGYFLVYWFYGAYCETHFNGQTLGKRITHMRVISVDGHAIDGVQATLRNFFRLLDTMPWVSFTTLFQLDFATPEILPTCLFGLLIMTLTPRFQRVGDLVANTVVVNEEKARKPELAVFDDNRVPRLAEEIPASFVVSASMSRALADYVDHRGYLAFQRASEIASHIATPLLDQFGIPQDTDHDLFLCALYYKTFIATQMVESRTTVKPINDAKDDASATEQASQQEGS